MHLNDFLVSVPKAELHCHYMGTLRHSTLKELSARDGIELPSELLDGYHFGNFQEFIQMARIATQALRHRDDFARVAYEALADGLADANVIHREFHVEADYFISQGISFETVMSGVVEGMAAAKDELGVTSRAILAIDRELNTPEEAVALVRKTLEFADPLLCGIGLAGPEGSGPPELFAKAYQLAAAEGLRRTNHVGEDNQPIEKAPPQNYRTSRDLLLCERYDHGNNLVHSPEVLAEAAADGASFGVVTFPSAESRRRGRWDSIQKMVDAGVRITINSDDPAMFGVTVADCYTTLFDELDWGLAEAKAVVGASFEDSWLTEAEKRGALEKMETAFTAYESAIPAR